MKTTLLFLHGALGSTEQMSFLGKEFSQFNTLFFEFSGHGKTPDVDRNWSIQEFSEQLLSFCKKHNTPLLVFGYSMGGYIALHLALRHPEQFKGIITFGTKLDWSPEVASKEILKLDPEKILLKIPQFAEELKARHGENRWKDVLRKTSELMISLGDHPVLIPEEMKSMTVPVLYGLGEKDTLVSLEETKLFQNATPGSELKYFTDTPHPIEQVNPGMFLMETMRFIESIERNS